MAKRPALSEDSFLKHLFSPKRNPLPTGIRKRAIAFTAGRSKARVASYNRMSGASQEMLRRANLRDAYLNGQVSLADAKKSLRNIAVGKGFAKPLRLRQAPPPRLNRSDLDMRNAGYIVRTLRSAGIENVNVGRVYHHTPYLPEPVAKGITRWSAGMIRAYAGNNANAIIINDEPVNPLWYK
jgi:hypothetical protein